MSRGALRRKEVGWEESPRTGVNLGDQVVFLDETWWYLKTLLPVPCTQQPQLPPKTLAVVGQPQEQTAGLSPPDPGGRWESQM